MDGSIVKPIVLGAASIVLWLIPAAPLPTADRALKGMSLAGAVLLSGALAFDLRRFNRDPEQDARREIDRELTIKSLALHAWKQEKELERQYGFESVLDPSAIPALPAAPVSNPLPADGDRPQAAAGIGRADSADSHATLSSATTVDPTIDPESTLPLVGDRPLLDLTELDSYPIIVIHGGQGAGKTTLATVILGRRAQAGHTITVLDPHAEAGQWDDYSLVGAGMDYEAIDEAMVTFETEVKERYERRSKTKGIQFSPMTVYCDEFTNWATRTKNAASFFKTGCSDIRKVESHILVTSHVRTLPGLGDAKGFAALRDSSILEIELFPTVDAVTGKAAPSGNGRIKRPGQDWLEVRIPSIPIGDRSSCGATPSVGSIANLEQLLASDRPLPEPLPTILSAAADNGGAISVRQCQRLKGIANKYSAEQIKRWFETLKSMEFGAIQIDPTQPSRVVFWLYDNTQNR